MPGVVVLGAGVFDAGGVALGADVLGCSAVLGLGGVLPPLNNTIPATTATATIAAATMYMRWVGAFCAMDVLPFAVADRSTLSQELVSNVANPWHLDGDSVQRSVRRYRPSGAPTPVRSVIRP